MLKSDWLLIAEPVQIRKFAFRSAPISHVVDPTGTEDVMALKEDAIAAANAAAVAAVVAAIAASVAASFAVCEAAACAADAAIIAEVSSSDGGAGHGLAEPTFSSIRVFDDTDW